MDASGTPSGNATGKAEEDDALTDEQALAFDAGVIAEQLGISQEAALVRLEAQQAFGEFAADVAARYVENFSGSWIAHYPDFELLVRFVGLVPEEVRERADAFGLEVTFLDDGAITLVDLAEKADRLSAALADAGFREFATAFDVITQKVVATVRVPAELEDASQSELRERLPNEVQSDDVTIEFTDGPVGVDDSTQATSQASGDC